MIPRGKANALVNRNEDRISREAYDLYVFLKQHPSFSTAPHRFKDVLRASVSGTPFGFIFRGLISVAAAKVIDQHILSSSSGDPCATLHRDHFYTWKSNADYFLSQPLLNLQTFWAEMKQRNEVVLVTREEHRRLSGLQRIHGNQAYAVADIQLTRVSDRAMKLAGYKAALVAAHWPPEAERVGACLPFDNGPADEYAQPCVAAPAPQATPR
jgi:hypothetical protein